MARVDEGGGKNSLQSPEVQTADTSLAADYESEIAILVTDIQAKTARVESLESIIIQMLGLLNDIPHDLINKLASLGIEVHFSDNTQTETNEETDRRSYALGDHIFEHQVLNTQEPINPDGYYNEAVVKVESQQQRECKRSTRPSSLKRKTVEERIDGDDQNFILTTHISISGRKCKRLKITNDLMSGRATRNSRVKVKKPRKSSIQVSSEEELDCDFEPESTCDLLKKDDIYQCSVPSCGVTFATDKQLKFHSQQNHPDDKGRKSNLSRATDHRFLLFCEVKKCPASFENRDDLLDHMKRHHSNDKMRTCAKCKQLFTTHAEKEAHFKTCDKVFEDTGPFICEFCGKDSFENSAKLRLHIHNHNNYKKRTNNGEKIPCHICSRMIITSAMKAHVATHEKPMMCETCPSSFSNNSLLKLHRLRVHGETGLAKFKCQRCDMLFIEQPEARKHSEICNAKTLDYQCKHCSKAFPCQKYLTTHVKAVHAEKVHKCDHCSSSFGLKSRLNSHIRVVHQRIKSRRACPICKEMFPTEAAANAHRKEEHKGVKRYQCVSCEAGFMKRDRFKAHLTETHNLTIEEGNKEMKVIGPGNNVLSHVIF